MKILKLFISLSLILSVSLINSLAAISVSDGSAFVTKAEFAADLNNLSNRMSSLENSLDAKIDSLVSTYLSRNGIWNGEKQTFFDYTEEKVWSNKWCDNSTGNETIKNDPISVAKVSKSGLAKFNFNILGKNAAVNSVTTHGTLFKVTSNYTADAESAKAVINVSYEILNKENMNVVFSNMFYTFCFNSIHRKQGMVAYLPSYTFENLFFVEKDQELTLRLVVITEGDNWISSLFTKSVNYNRLNPKLKFNSIVIY